VRPADPRRHRGQQARRRTRAVLAGIDQHEAAGAVGDLHLAGMDAALPHQRRLLVAGHPADRQGPAQDVRRHLAVVGRAVQHRGQQRARYVDQGQHLVRPVLRLDVEQQGARGVGGVGDVRALPRQPPDDPGVDRAAQQLARLGPPPRAGDLVQDPGDLGPREIRIQQQAGGGGDGRLMAFGPQAVADLRGAAVLPDDGRVDWPARGFVPDHHRLALVGDPKGGDVGAVAVALLDGVAQHANAGGVDLVGVVLDPAVARITLAQGRLASHTGRPSAWNRIARVLVVP
jgi:hypothetical protein